MQAEATPLASQQGSPMDDEMVLSQVEVDTPQKKSRASGSTPESTVKTQAHGKTMPADPNCQSQADSCGKGVAAAVPGQPKKDRGKTVAVAVPNQPGKDCGKAVAAAVPNQPGKDCGKAVTAAVPTQPKNDIEKFVAATPLKKKKQRKAVAAAVPDQPEKKLRETAAAAVPNQPKKRDGKDVEEAVPDQPKKKLCKTVAAAVPKQPKKEAGNIVEDAVPNLPADAKNAAAAANDPNGKGRGGKTIKLAAEDLGLICTSNPLMFCETYLECLKLMAVLSFLRFFMKHYEAYKASL